MSWTEPKRDYDEDYTLSPEDMNRVESNLKHLRDETGDINGVKTFTQGLKTDSISEETTGKGVDIDGVSLKDGGVNGDINADKLSIVGEILPKTTQEVITISVNTINQLIPRGIYHHTRTLTRNISTTGQDKYVIEINIDGTWYEAYGNIVSAGSEINRTDYIGSYPLLISSGTNLRTRRDVTISGDMVSSMTLILQKI